VNFAEEGGQDYTLYLRVEIERKELDSFLNNSPFAGKTLRTDRRYTSAREEEWWLPSEKCKRFESCFVVLKRDGYGEPVDLLIDLDNPEKATLYLEYTGKPIW
jgi:hypothetical protein